MNRHLSRLPGLCLAGLTALTLPQQSLAWGNEGHEIVASIAYARLTPAVRKKVDRLLAADRDALTPRDFVSRATWADRYRDADRLTTHVQYNATHNWHFVDIEIDGGSLDEACHHHPPLPAGTVASKGPAKQCVVDKVEQFATELGQMNTGLAEKQVALKFLVHFVGDMHQPLHAADHQDGGGNAVKVIHGQLASPVSLHSYWDTYLVTRLGRDSRVVGAQLNLAIKPAQASDWARGEPATWVLETHALAKKVAYNFAGEASQVDDHGGTAERLDAVYEARALPVVKQQLGKAGVRLAELLNRALK
jgi:hypothetical protein